MNPNRVSALALVGAFAVGASMLATPSLAAPFDITSSALRDGGMLAKKNAGNIPKQNCDGQGVSAAGMVRSPADTKSYASSCSIRGSRRPWCRALGCL